MLLDTRYSLLKSNIFLLLIVCSIQTFAQGLNPFANKDDKLTPARYEINTKRIGVDYQSKDALSSAREFKRLDPTYYVGWMLEGTYNHSIAEDEIGYSNAIEPLEKAVTLIEKDYNTLLKTRTNDITKLISILTLHRDYDYINHALYESYSYTNQYNKAWNSVRHYLKYNLQDENYMDSYNTLSWMVHRNRFYTKEKYYFLKNNIEENEKYANALLDSAIKKVNLDYELNKPFYADFLKTKMTGVYHYKAILYSYAMNIPSAEYYFSEMKKNGYFPENNYANFCLVQAKFRDAENYFTQACQNESDKRLRECVYYKSILNAYKATPKECIAFTQDYVKGAGTTPGYGWYQLALSRSFINDGEFWAGTSYAQKAEQFKEVHIGTTLGQSHYDFTTSVLKLMAKEQEQASVNFENTKWYFSPSAIWKKISLGVEKFMIQYVIINQFSNNPERDDVIYKLFNSESTISFDEVWNLVKDYSTQFFINKFQKQLDAEKRPNVKKYFNLLIAKLYLKENNYTTANTYLKAITDDKNYDAEYEKLFTFRVLECKLKIAQHNNNEDTTQEIIAQMYCLYPQWMPYNGNKVTMKLHLIGTENNTTKKIISKLNNANINWTNTKDANTQDVFIEFEEKANLHILHFNVVNSNHELVVNRTTVSYANIDEAFTTMLYGIFNIGDVDKGLNVGEVVVKKEK